MEINEVVWPLGRDDYLFVCDCHPVHYRSYAAIVAALGEDDYEAEAFNPPHFRHEYQVMAHRVGLRWMTLTELCDEMECGKREVASIARHLKDAVEHGLLERRQVPKTIRGIQRLRWSYRMRESVTAADAVDPSGDSEGKLTTRV